MLSGPAWVSTAAGHIIHASAIWILFMDASAIHVDYAQLSHLDTIAGDFKARELAGTAEMLGQGMTEYWQRGDSLTEYQCYTLSRLLVLKAYPSISTALQPAGMVAGRSSPCRRPCLLSLPRPMLFRSLVFGCRDL